MFIQPQMTSTLKFNFLYLTTNIFQIFRSFKKLTISRNRDQKINIPNTFFFNTLLKKLEIEFSI